MSDVSLQDLVDEYYDRLFRAAVFLTSSPTAAEELVQDTFMAAGEGLDRFEGRSSHYTWLYGILRNKYYKWVRDQKRNPMSLEHMTGDEDSRRPAGVLEGEEKQPLENLAKKEDAREVREAVSDLPPHHRDVLLLRFMEGLPYQDIAEEMDCSIGTVKSRIHYALKKVGRRLGPREGPEEGEE